ncbi:MULTISPECIES: hypothetical protein [unclassified Frigoribacterium]|uniref:hypothetical protein n=1 Tax=unclassified Frigoribacterium TaxID=2627005 RepID=UPI0006FCB1F3|nr:MULTISPECIES: hypothetical protein [unclassified Frigoribacterium]KQM23377.1 hypothetical protein ASL10_15300 [Frigoribacterium sp. Leaf8]MBP1189821.1 hypothetical protein [Frigoribacterium sp. PvP032]WAC51857.1 hypothetical protein OVA02_00820 [Frigoribacterium sp. SL97]
METVPLVMTVIGALIVAAGFAYTFNLRKRGGVRSGSRPFLAMTITIGLGTGILVAGVIAALS